MLANSQQHRPGIGRPLQCNMKNPRRCGICLIYQAGDTSIRKPENVFTCDAAHIDSAVATRPHCGALRGTAMSHLGSL